MIRTDKWLKQQAAVIGYNPEYVNPASVDVCLGEHIIEYSPFDQNRIYDELAIFDGHMEDKVVRMDYHLEEGEEFTFKPGNFYLCHTKEYTRIPVDHCAQLILKSSSGRKGLDHAHSGWGDPGFHGQWTFEFVAHKPVKFTRDQRIAQLVFMQCDSEPEEHYGKTGRYNGQTLAQEAIPDEYTSPSESVGGMDGDLESLLVPGQSPF